MNCWNQELYPGSGHERVAYPFLILPTKNDVQLVHDAEHERNLLILGAEEPYPSRVGAGPALLALMLESVPERKGQLFLPANYVTLGQALNDAAGHVSERGQVTARMLFEELGSGLAQLIRGEGKVPKDLSYLNVIYSREENGAKLLPPIEIIEVDDKHIDQAVGHITGTLWESLQEGASNKEQNRLLLDSFGGFVKSIQG